MPKRDPVSFLEKTTNKILHTQIKNICSSYSHPWDILAELTQNSIDAIRQFQNLYGSHTTKEHEINLTFNVHDRSISIKDTGLGFSLKSFAELIAPHGTDKPGAPDTIGEKGVGLTYTIFTCNKYCIESKSIDGYLKGYIKDAYNWRKDPSTELPKFQFEEWEENEFDPKTTFTQINLKNIRSSFSDHVDIFRYSIKALEFILRTKTAIGWVKQIFESEQGLNIKVNLTYIDLEGNSQQIEIKPTYLLPEFFLKSNSLMNLKDFKENAATMDDAQKANRLRGKAIFTTGSTQRAGRNIRYYVFFAPTRKLWNEISEKGNLFITDESGEKEFLYKPGIFVASRGMPTGISIDHPETGYAGYWPNFLMILEDNSIEFDLGRKAIPGRTKGLLRDIAGNLFGEFRPFIQYATSDPAVTGTGTSTIQQYNKKKIFDELMKLPDLGIEKINYMKHPDSQEAAVVALFHELIGADLLKGYKALRTGYKETYDLWCIYNISKEYIGESHKSSLVENGILELPIVIEYKYQAEDILPDVVTERKSFENIDLIVCWDLKEKKFSDQGVSVKPLPEEDVLFFGSNYLLTWPGAYNLGSAGEKPVLSLRRFVEKIRTE
jgi:molecular chaperone HtpG